MRYIKEIDGKNVIRTLNRIVVYKNGKQFINPSKEMVLADGWVEYALPVQPEPSEEQIVERARQRKLDELHEHDESNNVNDCIIVYQGQELHYWADKTERDSLKGAVRDYLSVGRVNYRLDLREIGVSLWIPCELLLGMLAQLEVYAADCYNKTTDHEFAIKSLATKDEIEDYDFRVGYPSIPRFEL